MVLVPSYSALRTFTAPSMNPLVHLLSLAAIYLAIPVTAPAQDAPKPAGGAAGDPEVRGAILINQGERETVFKKSLTNATFTGRWTPIKDGALAPEKDESYHIVDVARGEGDSWTINARMKYGQQEIVAPIPVQVKWAGDTAVIIVDNLTIPGGGTYNARVLVFKNTYAGTWSG